MTLGEKIKEARKQCGLSQEQLAEKMAVSRSAVAKWEANNGLPDVENLKALAQLLNVSVDYLLDDGEVIDEVVMREPYNLSDYGKGIKKKKKDRVIREKFPDAEIHTLLGKLKLTKSEKSLIIFSDSLPMHRLAHLILLTALRIWIRSSILLKRTENNSLLP